VRGRRSKNNNRPNKRSNSAIEQTFVVHVTYFCLSFLHCCYWCACDCKLPITTQHLFYSQIFAQFRSSNTIILTYAKDFFSHYHHPMFILLANFCQISIVKIQLFWHMQRIFREKKWHKLAKFPRKSVPKSPDFLWYIQGTFFENFNI